MDVIEYKLASNNPTLISHAIWKLLDAVKEKVENGESESKITELKFLLSQCESNNGIISITACQALVTLAESRILPTATILSNLTVCLGKAKHCGMVASAICNLLTLDLKTLEPEGECPFTLKTLQHPLITVLVQKKEAWKDLLMDVQAMLNHCEAKFLERYVTLLRPLFLYILCDPKLSLSESCRQQAWHLLVLANGTIELQIEILQWLQTASLERCLDTNYRILELAEITNTYSNKSFSSALVFSITSMALELLRKNGDPRSNLDMVSNILDRSDYNSGNVLMCLVAEMITICPSIYLLDIVTIAAKILDKTRCNRTVAHVLISSILQWMAYPTVLCSEALDLARNLIKKIVRGEPKNYTPSESESDNKFKGLYKVDANLQFYMELCCTVESLNRETILPWLEKLSKSPNYILPSYKLIIAGVFLESNNQEIIKKTCRLLVELSKNGGQILPTILYKLSNTRDCEQTKTLLFALPRLTRSKENVPIVMSTLKTLSAAGKPLNYVAIELYVQALTVEPRCHRHLQTALVQLSNTDTSWQSDVTCARAMKYICENHSEHGAELVPLLSQILNRCSSKSGSAASALSLNGISALCVAGVIEICSTWRVLAPKMNEESRVIVVQAICELFGDIPLTPSQEGTEYGKLMTEVLTKLWDYALNSKKLEIVESAFKALQSYKLSNMPLCVLPVDFINRVEKPETINSRKNEEEEDGDKTENLFPYIPAHYWILLLENINRSSLPAASNFFQHFIGEELHSFRTGIYRWPHGEPGNFKYLSEKSPLRAIGEYIRTYKSTHSENKKTVTIECMRIFSHKYLKALPPIEFSHFKPAIEISSKTREYGLSLACHQAPISPSAKEYVEKHMTAFTKKCGTSSPEEFKECLNIYKKLDDVCRAVGSNVLGPFLDTTLNNVLEKACRNNEYAIAMFDEIMDYFAKTLKDELIHNDNRSLITSNLEKMMDRIDVDSRMFKSYTNAALQLTTEHLERMTLPSVWLQITPDKLRKAIIIRAELVLKRNDVTPLSWMNEIIRASSSTRDVHSCLLEQLQRILPEIRLEKSNAAWTLNLMRRIGSILIESQEKEENLDAAIFLCEILFISVVCLSATDCILLNDRSLVTSHLTRAKLFPQAVASIVQTAYWKDIIPQTMEWLNHMRTTSIPRMYKIVFHNALVSLKNEVYFDVAWTKYLSIRAPINA
ncbi:focadhesin [Venturia canescens]|uniref:focadhesin n=1 Tax=Venturia canescens TaxID=32260 RepID=UPI001C9D0946|nr:focadhesin [Venturia canescens]